MAKVLCETCGKFFLRPLHGKGRFCSHACLWRRDRGKDKKRPVPKACAKCGGPLAPKPWQVKTRNWLCSACRNERDKKYYAERKALGRPIVKLLAPLKWRQGYEQEYKQRPGVREARAARRREDRLVPSKKFKMQVRDATRDAIKSGRLVRQPCEVCGNPKSESHHDDYTKPLKVRWLCRTHHTAHHAAENRRLKAAAEMRP